MTDFSNLSNFLPTAVYDSLQHAARTPANPPVVLLQASQLNDLKRKASAMYPHLRFELPDAKYRLDRAAKLARTIATYENKVRVWKREMDVVQQPEAFDKALSSLYHEMEFSSRMERDRGGRRRSRVSRIPISSSSSSSDEEWEDFEEEEVVPVVDPPLVVTETDYKDEWSCSICLMSDEANVVETACGHPYHHSCLMGLISNTAQDGRFRCCVCRQHLSVMDQPNPVTFPDGSESSSSTPTLPNASAPASPNASAPASSIASAPPSPSPSAPASPSASAPASPNDSAPALAPFPRPMRVSDPIFRHDEDDEDDDDVSTASSLGSLVDRAASAHID